MGLNHVVTIECILNKQDVKFSTVKRIMFPWLEI